MIMMEMVMEILQVVDVATAKEIVVITMQKSILEEMKSVMEVIIIVTEILMKIISAALMFAMIMIMKAMILDVIKSKKWNAGISIIKVLLMNFQE